MVSENAIATNYDNRQFNLKDMQSIVSNNLDRIVFKRSFVKRLFQPKNYMSIHDNMEVIFPEQAKAVDKIDHANLDIVGKNPNIAPIVGKVWSTRRA